MCHLPGICVMNIFSHIWLNFHSFIGVLMKRVLNFNEIQFLRLLCVVLTVSYLKYHCLPQYLEDTQYSSSKSLIFYHPQLDLESIWNVLDFLIHTTGLLPIEINSFILFGKKKILFIY